MASQQEDYNIPPIEDFVFAGIVQRVQDVFHTSNVTFISTNDRYKVAKLRENFEKSMQLAQVFLHLTSLNSDPSIRGNVRAMVRKGTYTSTTKDQEAVRNVKIMPCEFSVECIFLTQDFKEGLRFAKRWLFSSQRGGLNFTVTYDDVPVDVPIHQDVMVTVPDKDNAADLINTYEYLATMQVIGYISDEDNISLVPIVQNTTVGIGVDTPGQAPVIVDEISKRWDESVHHHKSGPTFLNNF